MSIKIKYNVEGKQRRKLADCIGESIGTVPRYLGVPSCNYQIGECILERDGTLTIPDGIDSGAMLDALKAQGWESEATGTDRLTISLLRNTLPDEKITVLEQIIASRADLLKKAIGTDTLTVIVNDSTIEFPWFPFVQDGDQVKAYADLVCKLCEMANRQKRTGAVRETDNEKYTFRCFLLRLGMIGDEYKITCKILLQNLTGNSAFRHTD